MEACLGKNYEDYRYAEGGNFKLRHITVARFSHFAFRRIYGTKPAICGTKYKLFAHVLW